jgi:uroporphyrinogen-III synthase
MTEIVVVTASAGTLPGLTQALTAIPIVVEEHPLMSFAAPADWATVDQALDRADSYGAVAFTSPRAAEAVARRLEVRGLSLQRGLSAPAVWAGGSATRAALGRVFGAVRTPDETAIGRWGAAGALARAMTDAGVVSPVLFFCGEIRRDELPERLRSNGLEVDEVVCYRAVLAGECAARTAAARGTVLVVSSPRVAALLAGACPPGTRPRLVAVGPTTASSARQAGWSPAAVAAQPSVEAVANAVRSVVERRSVDD